MVIDSVRELAEMEKIPELLSPGAKTKLFGGSGVLQSMSLVSLIVDLEQKTSERFGKELVLADEKAMSRRTSPFRNVESLALYIQELLEDSGPTG
jgi:hypothetical protein